MSFYLVKIEGPRPHDSRYRRTVKGKFDRKSDKRQVKMQVYLKMMSGEIQPMVLDDDVETCDDFLGRVYGQLGDSSWKVLRQTEEGEFEEITLQDDSSLEVKEEEVFSVMKMEQPPYEVAIQLSSSYVYNMNDGNDYYRYYDIVVIRYDDEGMSSTTIQGMYVKEENGGMCYYREEESLPAYRMGRHRDGDVEWEIDINARTMRYDTLESLMKGSKLEEGLTEMEAKEQREKIMEEWNGWM